MRRRATSSRRASVSRSSTSTPMRAASSSIRRIAFATSSAGARGAHPEELGVAADRHQRRAQLVRRIGDEAAQPILARLARGERVLERSSMRFSAIPSRPTSVRVGRLDAVGEIAAGDRRRRCPIRSRGSSPTRTTTRAKPPTSASTPTITMPLDEQQLLERSLVASSGIAATVVAPPRSSTAARGSRRASRSSPASSAGRSGARGVPGRGTRPRGVAGRVAVLAVGVVGARRHGGGPPSPRRRLPRPASRTGAPDALASCSSIRSSRSRATRVGDRRRRAASPSARARARRRRAGPERRDHARGGRSV